jgi:uncharacterized membrane protein
MNRFVVAASTLTAALGLLAVQTSVKAADAMTPELKQKLSTLEKCYGVNAAAKNDCANAAHSCAGQTTAAKDTKSFVLLPAGACSKIAGGSTTAS